MEPLTVSALAAAITALFNSAADEAGKSAWTTLTTAISRRLGHASAEANAIAQVEEAAIAPQTHDLPTATTQAAEILLALAHRDQAFAELLQAVQGSTRTTINNSSVTNTISGHAQVNKSVQLDTNYGDINIS